MPFEQCFSRLPAVNALDNAKAWRPSYREWLSAQFEEGVDHTTVARLLEDNDIGEAEAAAGESDAAWMLRRAADDDDFQLGDALDFIGAKKADAPHAHALSETDWKSSPWYRKEIPFRPDMTPTRARLMAENFDRRRFRERLLARGDEIYNGPGDMALGFGATLLGSIADPVSFIPFGGGVAAARGAGTLGRALWAGARSGVVNGAASAALVDGLILPDLASRGEDVAFSDLVLDTLAGGVLGLVFGAAGGLFAHRAARRRGTADATPARLAEAAPAREPTPFEVSPDAARNAEADLLRQGWTAGDRRAVADAAALGMEDLAEGRPVDVAAVLRESKALERARREALSPVVVRSEDLGVPEGAGLSEYIAAAKVYHDALKLESESGKPVIQPQLERPVRFSRKGWRKNQSTGADVDKWKLFPKLREIIETSTLKSTEAVNKPRKDGFVRFHWVENVVELDGSPRLVGVMLAEDKEGNLFYNINADVEGWRAKKGDPSNLPAQSMTGESGSPIQAEAAAPPVVSTLAEEGAGVNLHVEGLDRLSPDFSTAPEPPAPPRMTPDEARRAENETLAGQDEALRQRVTERKGRR